MDLLRVKWLGIIIGLVWTLPLYGQKVEMVLWQPTLPYLQPPTYQEKIAISGEIIADTAIHKVAITIVGYNPDQAIPCPAAIYYHEADGKNKAVFRTEATIRPLSSVLAVQVALQTGKAVTKTFPLPCAYTNAQYKDDFDEIVLAAPHKDAVRWVAFTKDSRYLISCGDDHLIHILVPQTLKIVRSCKGHSGYVRKALPTPDGRFIVSASDDKTVRIWELETGRLLHTFSGLEAPAYALTISPDGKLAASAGQKIRVWDLENKTELGNFGPTSNQYLTLIFTPDGKYLISGDEDRFTIIWSIADKSITYKRTKSHTDGVSAVVIDPNMQCLYTGDRKGGIKWWRVLVNDKDTTREDEDYLLWEMRLCYVKGRFEDPAMLTSSYVTENMKDYTTIHAYPVYNMTKDYDEMPKGEWKKKTDKFYSEFDLGGGIVSLQLNGTGEYLLIATAEGEVRIVETLTALKRCSFTISHNLLSAAFAYDGSMAAASDMEGKIWVYGKKKK